jgi:uncharacterized membrane protein YphA (DoxX/SURF4 family)
LLTDFPPPAGLDLSLLAARFFLAFLFILAGVSKIPSSRFAPAVRDYRLIPDALVRPVSSLLPGIEIAAALLLGLGLIIRPSALLLAALLVIFAIAVAVNLARGRKVDCGCFAGRGQPISSATLVRALALGAISLAVAIRPPLALSLDSLIRSPHRPVGSASDALAMAVVGTLGAGAFRLLAEMVRLFRPPDRADRVDAGWPEPEPDG